MDVFTAILAVASALLLVAGAQKVIDPAPAAGTLRALRLPSSVAVVRVGAAAEALLGTLALVVTSPVLASLVAVSYLAFAAFVLAALPRARRSGRVAASGARTLRRIRTTS